MKNAWSWSPPTGKFLVWQFEVSQETWPLENSPNKKCCHVSINVTFSFIPWKFLTGALLHGSENPTIQHNEVETREQLCSSVDWAFVGCSVQCPGSFRAYRVGQDPSDSKSSRLHVDIFRFWCFHSFKVYSVNFSKTIGNPTEVSNFNELFLKLNRFICN